MIWTVFVLNLQRLRHNRVELLLLFVVPIAFFSIFALIFGKGVGGSTAQIKAVVVDQANTPASQTVVKTLIDNAGLRMMRTADAGDINAREAERLVRIGGVAVAILIRDVDHHLSAELLTDASDQVAGQLASAIVTRSLLEVQATRQSDRLATRDPMMTFQPGATETPPVQMVDVMGQGKANPVVSMYAAGIAVMFLLFGATGGGGALLEEKENQTLGRLLSTRLSMDQLLLGKWFYLTTIGIIQVTVMFLWGQLVFSIELLQHLDGFVMMTVVTSAAAASFGLLLATLCKTRGQLNGLSIILVLTMSALGGSMVPRYVMSESMRELGKWTFNAWALDGYDKVFWRDLPVSALAPQLGMLMLTGIAFLLLARLLALRWQTE